MQQFLVPTHQRQTQTRISVILFCKQWILHWWDTGGTNEYEPDPKSCAGLAFPGKWQKAKEKLLFPVPLGLPLAVTLTTFLVHSRHLWRGSAESPFFSWFTIFMESRRLGWFPSAFTLKIATLFKVHTAQPKEWDQTAAQSQSQWPQPESQRLSSPSSSPSPSSSEPELLQSSIFHIPTPGHGAHKRTATGQMRRHEYKPTRLHTSTHAHTGDYHF